MSETAVKELAPKLEGIYKEVTSLTVLELAELVKAMEDRLGIQAAAPAAAAVAGGA
ncbi:MAG: 50S ribosomal protein L7/L12, partial [Candidatus Omnitrophota bacterium]